MTLQPRLCADQLNDFTETALSKLEGRLAGMEGMITNMDRNLATLTARAGLWDNFHLHIEAWDSQITSLDQKLELLRRSQEEQQAEQLAKLSVLPAVNLQLEKAGLKLSELGGQLAVADGRLVALQDRGQEQRGAREADSAVLAGLQAALLNLTGGERGTQHRHSSSRHSAQHHTLLDIQTKVDRISRQLAAPPAHTGQQALVQSPRFDFLRSEPPGPSLEPDQEEEFSSAEDKFVSLFRKIATPFKRVNKRLMSMESLQDKIENQISNIKDGVEASNEDIGQKLQEFIASSTELAQEQNHMIENYAANFASLEQLCGDHSADMARFVSGAAPALDRLDRWMTSWQNLASQKFDRITQQNSYDHDTIMKGQKALESLMVEGLERCKMGGFRGNRKISSTGIRRSSVSTAKPTTTTTTSTTTTTTHNSGEDPLEDNTENLPFVDEVESIEEDIAAVAGGCEDLVDLGGSDVVTRVGIVR